MVCGEVPHTTLIVGHTRDPSEDEFYGYIDYYGVKAGNLTKYPTFFGGIALQGIGTRRYLGQVTDTQAYFSNKIAPQIGFIVGRLDTEDIGMFTQGYNSSILTAKTSFIGEDEVGKEIPLAFYPPPDGYIEP